MIVNPKQFTEAASGYTLVDNSKLVVKDTEGGTVQTFDKSNLKFYVSADDKVGGFFIEKTMTKADFPTDFDFNLVGATVPVISGDWTGNTVVAQKVTGDVKKQVDGTYEVYLSQYGDANKDFRVWGYGVGLDSKKEKDWAGVNAIVTDTNISGGTVTAGTPGSIIFQFLCISGRFILKVKAQTRRAVYHAVNVAFSSNQCKDAFGQFLIFIHFIPSFLLLSKFLYKKNPG